eukprot:3867782-Amphidinium_carterae.2
MTQVWKLWGRLRKPLLKAWQNVNAPDAFWSGKSCLRAAWESQLKAEAPQTVGLSSASFHVDLQKYFEWISHQAIAGSAPRSRSPIRLRLAAIAGYQNQRAVVCGPLVKV